MSYADKPFDTPEEALAHYGVLGMKWGKTRARASGSDIRKARRSVMRKSSEYQDKKASIKNLKDPQEKRLAREDLGRMKTDFLKDPDRAVAVRLTRGEKAAALILGFGVGGVTAVAATSAASRRIERKQETGGYNNR